jgi:hypothetical protein
MSGASVYLPEIDMNNIRQELYFGLLLSESVKKMKSNWGEGERERIMSQIRVQID